MSQAIYPYLAPYSTSSRTGDLFIRNAVWIHSFVTRASFDATVNVDDLPEGALYTTGLMHSEPLLGKAYLDTDPREGIERPGWAYLTCTEAPGIPEAREIEWRMPLYTDSGHMVTERQPTEFCEDVKAFLSERGALE